MKIKPLLATSVTSIISRVASVICAMFCLNPEEQSASKKPLILPNWSERRKAPYERQIMPKLAIAAVTLIF